MSEQTPPPSPLIQNKGPLIKFDGTIPVWGVVLIGIGWASYSWTTMNDQDKRLIGAEAAIVDIRKKNDQIDTEQRKYLDLLNRTSTDVQVVKELLIRLEKRLDLK